MAVALEVIVEQEVPGRGDPGAGFEALYARSYAPLVAYCRPLLAGTPADAEDVAQEALLRAWASWSRYTPARPFWPWVATIARRICVDERRRWSRGEARNPAEAALCARADRLPEDVVVASEDAADVRAALAQLAPRQRRMVAFRHVDGWSYDEIADFEGVSVESVRGTLRRARAALRRGYERVTEGAPAAVLGLPALVGERLRGWAGTVRDRIEVAASRFQQLAGPGSGVLDRLGDTLAAAVVAGIVIAGSPPPADGGGAFTAEPLAAASAARAPAASAPPVTAAQPAEGGDTAASSPAAPGAPVDAPAPPAAQPGPPPAQEPEGDRRRLAVAAPVELGRDGMPDDGARRPEDARIDSVGASDDGGTVYASGWVLDGCPRHACPVLFRSTDGGATWQRAVAAGFAGGAVLVAPGGARPDLLFAAGPGGLQRSDDDGASFRTVVVGSGGGAALSPDFADGDPRVLLGGTPAWEYDADADVARPLAVVPPAGQLDTIAFSPRYGSDRRLFAGGARPGTGGVATSTVAVCGRVSCTEQAVLSGARGTPEVAAFLSGEHLVLLAWTLDAVHRSGDGGTSFERVTVPIPGAVRSAASTADGTLLLASALDGDGGLARSTDRGATWTEVGADQRLARGVSALSVLPGDRIVAGLDGGGLLCSADAGTSWAPRCPEARR